MFLGRLYLLSFLSLPLAAANSSLSLRDKAEKELVSDAAIDQKQDSSALVKIDAKDVRPQVSSSHWELALGTSPFLPNGTLKLPGLEAYRLQDLTDYQPLIQLYGAYMSAHQLSWAQQARWGLQARLSWASSDYRLKTSQNYSEEVNLHSILWAFGPILSWTQSDYGWGLRTELGQVSYVQSADSSFLSETLRSFYGNLGLYGRYFWKQDLFLEINYDYKKTLNQKSDSSTAKISAHSLGLSLGVVL